MIKRIWNNLTSTKFALALFGVLSVLSLLGTFPGMAAIYSTLFFRALVGLLGLCTVLCSFRRRGSVRWQVHLIHGGVIVTMVGALMAGLGFVSTINVYEGDEVLSAFHWGLNRDEPLGFSMKVAAINTEFYPVPVKIGVLQGEEKVGLHTLKTGESFTLDRYQVRADRFINDAKSLTLTVMENGRVIGSVDTEGAESTLPERFPFSFKLVAFVNPTLKRMWVDLLLSRNNQLLVKGVSEVNSPLKWNGIAFYNTQISEDNEGRRYAGIQIVKDPGQGVVFAGLALMSLGSVLACAMCRKRTKSDYEQLPGGDV